VWVRPARAVQVYEDEEKGISVKVGLLAQPWFQLTRPASADGSGAC